MAMARLDRERCPLCFFEEVSDVISQALEPKCIYIYIYIYMGACGSQLSVYFTDVMFSPLLHKNFIGTISF